MKKIIIITFILLNSILAEQRLLIFPIYSTFLDRSSLITANSIITQELDKCNKFTILKYTGESPENLTDAFEIGAKENIDNFVYISINKLGNTFYVLYNYVDIKSHNIIQENNIRSETLDDLDIILKRIATAICTGKSVEKINEVGLITDSETKEPNLKSSFSYSGIGFGYLYPQTGFDNDFDRIFFLDIKSCYETHDYLVEGLLGFRKGTALNIGISKIFTNNNFAPYIGVGMGFHWVSHKNEHSNKKRGDGIELLFKTGLLGFRVYDFRFMLQLDYGVIFNDYNDKYISLSISLMRLSKKRFLIF